MRKTLVRKKNKTLHCVTVSQQNVEDNNSIVDDPVEGQARGATVARVLGKKGEPNQYCHREFSDGLL